MPLASEGSPEAPSDIAALTGRLLKGDEAAYRTFYGLYFDRLLRYLFVVTGGNEDATRDALQAAFLRAVRHMRRFESDAVLWSWLTVLARSAVIDQQRKESRYRKILRRFFPPGPPEPVVSNFEPDPTLTNRLDTALQSLSPEDRELVQRKYYTGQSVREIAAALGSTEKAIESRLVRVRRVLKQSILEQINEKQT